MVKGPGRPATKQRYGHDGSGITASNATRWENGHGQSNRNRGFTGGSPAEGTSWPKYCIFCEQNTHNTTHCTIKKYTAQYKENKCKKHNACFMCFRTTEHKAQTCPKLLNVFSVHELIISITTAVLKSMNISREIRIEVVERNDY